MTEIRFKYEAGGIMREILKETDGGSVVFLMHLNSATCHVVQQTTMPMNLVVCLDAGTAVIEWARMQSDLLSKTDRRRHGVQELAQLAGVLAHPRNADPDEAQRLIGKLTDIGALRARILWDVPCRLDGPTHGGLDAKQAAEVLGCNPRYVRLLHQQKAIESPRATRTGSVAPPWAIERLRRKGVGSLKPKPKKARKKK